MNRNQYDGDVTVWSPEGRLYQVEYAMEAVKQGGACLGFTTSEYTVLAGLKRSPSPLASYTKKLFKLDDHMGIAVSGLIPDARSLMSYMRSECLNYKYAYDSPMVTGRLVAQVADKHQKCTQSYVRRPYGVGLLVAGYDESGPHLYETRPDGAYVEWKAVAIGNRAQSAKTYLDRYYNRNEEKGVPGFEGMDADELIKEALKALQGCIHGDDKELDALKATVSIVGKDRPFEVLEGAAIAPYVEAIAASGDAVAEEKDDGGMDVEM